MKTNPTLKKKQYYMPGSFIDFSNITYCGKEAQQIFAKDIFDIDLRSYGVTFMDGVKGKRKIYNGDLGDVWQVYTCPFTPQGEVSLAEAFIEPAELKINLEECFDKFYDTYLVEQTSITLNGGIPQTFSEWFFARLRKKMAKEYQEIFWQGDTARTATTKTYLKVTDGVEKKLSGATQVTGAAITVDNVIAQVEAAINAGIAAADSYEVDPDPDTFKVAMRYQDVRVLETALGKLCCGNSTQQVFSNYAKRGDKIYVLGYEIVPTMQTKNTIIFGPIRNLVLGFDTFDSHLEYKLIDMRDTTGDNSFRVIALSNIATGIVMPELFAYSKA